MNKNLQISCAEAKFVLKHLTKEEKEKIPAKLRRFITDNCDKEHEVDINKLSKRTYALLAVIYRKYLAENKPELQAEYKARLKKENAKRLSKNKPTQKSSQTKKPV